MRDKDLDDLLNRVSGSSPDVDPALLERVSRSIGESLKPVRPLPPPRRLVMALIAACAVVAAGSGIFLGPHGIQSMTLLEMSVIFPVLGILIWLAADVSVSGMIPGRRRRAAPWVLLALGCLALTEVFAMLFHDYRVERFVPQGMTCLTAGLVVAIPAAIGGWLILRRGFAVDSLAAGFVQGILAGLAGVAMLELHCANFEAPHVMVWHTAVLPLSGAAGAMLAWVNRKRRSRQLR